MSPVYWKPKYGTRSSRHRAWARQEARGGATVVVAGSLFLVGALRAAAAAGTPLQRAGARRPRK